MRDHAQTDIFTAPDSAIKLASSRPSSGRTRLVASLTRLFQAHIRVTPSEILLSLPAVVRLQELMGMTVPATASGLSQAMTLTLVVQ